jgi:hypothetical protein
MPGDDEDLTRRLTGLRDVLRDEVKAGQALATARMDGMDAARGQYLGSLAAERDALSARIQAIRDLARTENASLEQLLTVHLDKMQQQIDQRFAERDKQLTALQLQIDQRFQVESEARQVALDTATAAIDAALKAAETAVNKAEIATEKRFEGVNEFRASLADQTRTYIPRIEYDSSHQALADRVTGQQDRLAALELRLTSRLDRGEGADVGAAGQRTDQRLNMSQVIAGVATLAAVLSFILYVVKK